MNESVLGLKPGIVPRTAMPRQGRDPDPEFWEPHPEVSQGPVGWQLTRVYGPKVLGRLLQQQKFAAATYRRGEIERVSGSIDTP